MNREEFSKPVLEYISEHFPNSNEIDVIYVLRVMDEFLEQHPPAEIKSMLESYNVAQVVRDIRDFPIIVTNSGCIFGSP